MFFHTSGEELQVFAISRVLPVKGRTTLVGEKRGRALALVAGGSGSASKRRSIERPSLEGTAAAAEKAADKETPVASRGKRVWDAAVGTLREERRVKSRQGP